jgi:hypothetical protein
MTDRKTDEDLAREYLRARYGTEVDFDIVRETYHGDTVDWADPDTGRLCSVPLSRLRWLHDHGEPLAP